MFAQGRVIGGGGLVAVLHQLAIGGSGGVEVLAAVGEIVEPLLQIAQVGGAARARPVDLLRFRAHLPQALRERGEAGTCGEKQFAEIALAVENGVAAGFQRLVVEREHGAVGIAVDTGEGGLQQPFRQRLVGGIEQALLLLLDADQIARAVGERKPRTDAHGRVGMQEGVAALGLDAEQEVEPGVEERRLAGLVRSVDDVEVGSLAFPPEIEAVVGELAVADEVEAFDAHQASPLSGAPWRRARMSRAPSRARSSRSAVRAASSSPSAARNSPGSWLARSSASSATAAR